MWSIVLLNEHCVCGGTYSRSTVFVLVDLLSQICACGVVIYVDETPVGTVISPQIGELPEVLL